MNHAKLIPIAKHVVYTIVLLLFYVLQTVPGLFAVYGVRPMWVIPAAVSIAIFEGEFIGGIYGALAGLFCDMTSTQTLFGFNGFLVCAACVGIGLLVSQLMRGNLLGCLLFVSLLMLLRGSLEFLFAYGMWGHENVWRIYLNTTLPVMVYSSVTAPLPFWLVKRINGRLQTAME